MKVHEVLLVVCGVAAVATAYGARKAAGSGATVPAEAVAWHGAAELYRTLALHFGKRALLCEARYWEVVKHGG